MSDREYTWGPGGQAAATRRGVTTTEVVDALYAPAHLTATAPIGADLLMIAAPASTGRVIAVLCRRLASTTRHEILDARPLTGPEIAEWRRNL